MQHGEIAVRKRNLDFKRFIEGGGGGGRGHRFWIKISLQFKMSYLLSFLRYSPSGETRNLRPNTHFRGTNETEFMLIFDYSYSSIPFSIKLLKRSSFRKKIKELLLNFLPSEDDYVEVSGLIKLFNTLG